MAYRSTLALRVVAWMYLASGVVFFIAPFLAFNAAGGLGPNLILWPMAAVTVAAGVGLLRRAPWAWPYTLLVALSGVAVTVARLWAGGGDLRPHRTPNYTVPASPSSSSSGHAGSGIPLRRSRTRWTYSWER